MPSDGDKSENPYQSSSDEAPKAPKPRTILASLGVAVAIFVASGIAFVPTCAVVGYAGLVAATSSASKMPYTVGWYSGLIGGTSVALTVVFVLYRKEFRKP